MPEAWAVPAARSAEASSAGPRASTSLDFAMSELEGLPDTRTSLRGLTEEGHEAWLVRGIAGKLYRCPGCHGEIPIGTEHVVVHYVRRAGGSDHHHWHRPCAEQLLVPELRVAADSLRGLPELRSTSVHVGNRLSLQLVDFTHVPRPPSRQRLRGATPSRSDLAEADRV